MTIIEMRTRYQDNKEIIGILKEKLNYSYGDRKNTIIESIELLKEEQNKLEQAIEIYAKKKNMYKSFDKKDILNHKVKKEEPKREISRVENVENIDEIVLDKDSVTVTKVEETKQDNKNIKVINITEKAPDKIEQLAINVKKEKEQHIKEVKDAKIVFDGDFKIVSNDKVIYQESVNEVLLDHNMKDDLKPYNYNIMKLLENFDQKNGTDLYDRYLSNNIKVEYNFDNIKENSKRIKKIRKLSKKENKIFSNVTVNDNRNKKFRKGLTFIAAAGLLLFGGVNIAKNLSKTNNNTTAQSNSVVADAGQTDADIEIVTTEEVITTAKPTSVEKENVKDDKKENKVETKKDNNIEIKKDNNVEIKKDEVKTTEEPKEESIKVGDTYKLDGVDLYYASTDEAPSGDTEYAKYTNSIYEINLIAVVYNNQVMRLVNNDSLDINALESICKEKYGDSFKIFVNPNELDKDGNLVTKNVGWVPLEQLQSKGKVLKR